MLFPVLCGIDMAVDHDLRISEHRIHVDAACRTSMRRGSGESAGRHRRRIPNLEPQTRGDIAEQSGALLVASGNDAAYEGRRVAALRRR
jgi:hypothetical protein